MIQPSRDRGPLSQSTGDGSVGYTRPWSPFTGCAADGLVASTMPRAYCPSRPAGGLRAARSPSAALGLAFSSTTRIVHDPNGLAAASAQPSAGVALDEQRHERADSSVRETASDLLDLAVDGRGAHELVEPVVQGPCNQVQITGKRGWRSGRCGRRGWWSVRLCLFSNGHHCIVTRIRRGTTVVTGVHEAQCRVSRPPVVRKPRHLKGMPRVHSSAQVA